MKQLIFALLASFLWGVTPIIEKFAFLSKQPNPFVGVVFRTIGTAIMAFVLSLFILKLDPVAFKKIETKAIILFMIGGALASVIGQIFYYIALKSGDASVVTPIAGSFPLVTFIFGVLLLGEAITIPKLLGVLFIIAGVILLK